MGRAAHPRFAPILMTVVCSMTIGLSMSSAGDSEDGHEQLIRLFHDWREFERPPMLDGAPDYTAGRFAARQAIRLLSGDVSNSRRGTS